MFCALMALFGLGRLNESFQASLLKSRALARSQERSKAFQRDALREQERGSARGNSPTGGSRQMREDVSLMRDTARNLSGSERKELEAIARVTDAIQAKVQTFERAVKELEAVGFSTVVGLDSPEAITRRRALVRTYAEANTGLTEAWQGVELALHAELRGVVGEAEAERFAHLVAEPYDTDIRLRVRGAIVTAAVRRQWTG